MGDLEPRRRYIFEGWSLLERATNMGTETRKVSLLGGFGGAHIAILHNGEVVLYCEVMNSYVPCMGIQAYLYLPCNTLANN